MKDVAFYRLKDAPASLCDYLRTASPNKGMESDQQLEVIARIKREPAMVGLDERAEMFEMREFLNADNKTISCPDLIAFDKHWAVIEVGTERKRVARQLDATFYALHLNFGIRPALMFVTYSRQIRYFLKSSPLECPNEQSVNWSESIDCVIPWPSLRPRPRY